MKGFKEGSGVKKSGGFLFFFVSIYWDEFLMAYSKISTYDSYGICGCRWVGEGTRVHG